MLHIINVLNAHEYQDALVRMFRLRHLRFVEEQSYTAFTFDGMEFDRFDLVSTHYLVAIHQSSVVGCMRLNSTLYPYMLDEIDEWRAMMDEAPAHSDSVWEGSRICIDGEFEQRSHVRKALVVGMLEFALARKIHKLIGVMEDEVWKKVFGACDCAYTHWSKAVAFDETKPDRYSHAGYVMVDVSLLMRVRDRTGIHAPVLTDATRSD